MLVRACADRYSGARAIAAVALLLAACTAALLALLATAGSASADTPAPTTVGNATFTRAGALVSDVDPDSVRCRTFGFCGSVIYRSAGAGELVRVVDPTSASSRRFSQVEGYFGKAELRRGFAYTAEVRLR
jgi:hypothetical protein